MTKATPFRLSILSGLLLTLATAPAAGQSGMAAHRDIDYVDGVDYADDKDKLDVLMPAGATHAPVIVFFHGGALQAGDKRTGEVLASTLVAEGISDLRGVAGPVELEDRDRCVGILAARVDDGPCYRRRIGYLVGEVVDTALQSLLNDPILAVIDVDDRSHTLSLDPTGRVVRIVRDAEFVGSTRKLLNYVRDDPCQKFIIGTETGILHTMRKASPHKELISAPVENTGGCEACSECPYMKLNTMEKIYLALENLEPRIEMDEELRRKALIPVERMLAQS